MEGGREGVRWPAFEIRSPHNSNQQPSVPTIAHSRLASGIRASRMIFPSPPSPHCDRSESEKVKRMKPSMRSSFVRGVHSLQSVSQSVQFLSCTT